MSESEVSFYGTGSESPNTDELKRYAKSKAEAASVERELSKSATSSKDAAKPKTNITTGGAKVAVVKMNKGVSFIVKSVAIEKPPVSGKVICKRVFYGLLGTVVVLALLAFLTYAFIIPLVVYTNEEVRRRLMFIGWSRKSPLTLQTPSSLGLPCSTNSHIQTEQGTVGTWYIPPGGQEPCAENRPYARSRPVVIFVPTFEETRATARRVALLRIISQSLNCHVLAFDYRGTADSEGLVPTAESVITDTVQMYRHVRDQMNNAGNEEGIIIWADTWGGPVALQMLRDAKMMMANVSKVVLQSPVQNTEKAAREALPFNAAWRWLPFFYHTFVLPLNNTPGTFFDSVAAIAFNSTPPPTLILHAKDDSVVDVRQGRAIYQALDERRDKTEKVNISIYEFTELDNLGHSIERSPEKVSDAAKWFIDTSS